MFVTMLKKKYRCYLLLVGYCIVYVFTISECLLPNLMNGQEIVTSYNKFFSLPFFVLCTISVLFLYSITEKATRNRNSVVFYVLKILFLIYQIPVSMTLCIFSRDRMLKFWSLEMLYWMNICFITYLGDRIKKGFPQTLKVAILPIKFIRMALIVILIVGIALVVRKLGNYDFSISLHNVYGYRKYFKDNSSDLMTFFKVAIGNYLGPCLITYYVYKRKVVPALFFVLVQIAFYSMARDKTYLFLMPIAIILGIFGDSVVKRFDTYVSFLYITISGVSLLAAFNIFRTAIFEIFIRRAFVIPSFFNYIYFYFFDSNEPIWWRQDTFLIDKFFSPVYKESVPIVIANRMMDGKETNPNAGMFAEAFSRCGIWGIIIYPILIVLLLKMIDKCFKYMTEIAKVTLSICLAVSMANDVITSTAFVCTVVLIIIGSTYFGDRDCSRTLNIGVGDHL